MNEQEIVAAFNSISLDAVSPKPGLVEVYRPLDAFDENKKPVFIFRYYKVKGWTCDLCSLGVSTGRKLLSLLCGQ